MQLVVCVFKEAYRMGHTRSGLTVSVVTAEGGGASQAARPLVTSSAATSTGCGADRCDDRCETAISVRQQQV